MFYNKTWSHLRLVLTTDLVSVRNTRHRINHSLQQMEIQWCLLLMAAVLICSLNWPSSMLSQNSVGVHLAWQYMQYSFFNLDPWCDPVLNKVEAEVAVARLPAAEVCGSIWLERMWMRRKLYLHGPSHVQLVNTDPVGGCQLDAAGPSDFTALHELTLSFILVTVAGWVNGLQILNQETTVHVLCETQINNDLFQLT